MKKRRRKVGKSKSKKNEESDRQEGVSWTLNIDDVTYKNFDKMQRVFKVPARE